jgi:hypothetical protein
MLGRGHKAIPIILELLKQNTFVPIIEFIQRAKLNAIIEEVKTVIAKDVFGVLSFKWLKT